MEPVEFRRRLHAHPELSFKEHDTAAFIEQQLDELSIEHRRIASTGVVARIKGCKTPEGDRRAAVLFGVLKTFAEARDITSDIARLRDKVDAGAEYVITQMFFDNAKYFDFVRRCREAGITVPIIPGIKPLSTLRHLEILPETFGVKLPEELVREVKAHPDGVREVGTEWAIAQSRELMAAGVPVLHYYTMSRTTNIQKIVKAVF